MHARHGPFSELLFSRLEIHQIETSDNPVVLRARATNKRDEPAQ